jgi:hypothetical protein
VTAPKLCECGCGQPTNPAPKTCRRKGWVAGQPLRFIRGHAGGLATAQGARPRPTPDPPRTPTERYLENLLHRSKLIVGALRDDGPDELIRQIDLALAMRQPAGIDRVVALVVVLAAQIDPDTTDEQRLGWVRAFDPGAAQAPTPPRQLPVRASPRKETAA